MHKRRGTLGMAWLLATPLVSAQTTSPIHGVYQLTLDPPGVRSLGMGGVAAAMPEDMAAASLNPAALAACKGFRWEVDGAAWRNESVYADRGHAYGDPDPLDYSRDTLGGIREATSIDTSIGFASAGVSYGWDRFSLGVSTRRLVNQRASMRADTVFYSVEDSPFVTPAYNPPTRGRIDAQVLRSELVGAYTIGRWSMGIAAKYDRFSIDSRTDEFRGGLFEAPDYASSSLVRVWREDGSDVVASGGLGVLWHPLDWLWVGAAYQAGAGFHYRSQESIRPGKPGSPWYSSEGPATFDLPGSASLAVTALSKIALVSLEARWVAYSDVARGISTALDTSHRDLNRYQSSDALEVHLGAEHRFGGVRVPIALRGGIWSDPAHGIEFRKGESVEGYDNVYQRGQSLRFRRSDGQFHFSLGAALDLSSHVSIAAAVDGSKRRTVAALSIAGTF